MLSNIVTFLTRCPCTMHGRQYVSFRLYRPFLYQADVVCHACVIAAPACVLAVASAPSKFLPIRSAICWFPLMHSFHSTAFPSFYMQLLHFGTMFARIHMTSPFYRLFPSQVMCWEMLSVRKLDTSTFFAVLRPVWSLHFFLQNFCTIHTSTYQSSIYNSIIKTNLFIYGLTLNFFLHPTSTFLW